MGKTAENLRDLLSLSRMLRRHAAGHAHESNADLYLAAAAALETRVHLLAENVGEADLSHEDVLHHPVNLLV